MSTGQMTKFKKDKIHKSNKLKQDNIFLDNYHPQQMVTHYRLSVWTNNNFLYQITLKFSH